MQPGFFDLEDRYKLLEKLGDPLPKLSAAVRWEDFRAVLKKVREKPRKSNAGRKPFDEVLMFKVLVLQHLYNLSDDQIEYQIRDRYSFCRFLGLTPEEAVPDAKTVWLFREQLKALDLVGSLFDELMLQVEAAGYIPRKGQIVDAAMVEAPRQRNSREENARIKAGEVPEHWSASKRRQKDVQARWAKKHGKTYFGYKNHVSVDNACKLVRRYAVTDAAVSDTKVFEELLDDSNTSAEVWADSAYRSAKREQRLKADGYTSHIQHKGQVNKPLNDRAKQANRLCAKVRARIEHVFADQKAMGRRFVRTIGLARAKVKIGLMNFTYNLRRFAWLLANVRPTGTWSTA